MTQTLFELPDQHNQTFIAADHLPLIIYFYPKDNTPGCTLEAQEFNQLLPQFQALGYTVVGISRDSVKSHANFCNKQQLTLTLLSDPEETVCRQFDVIREKNMYGKTVLGIERSTFIIDTNGQISHQWRKVKAAGHAQAILNTLHPNQQAT